MQDTSSGQGKSALDAMLTDADDILMHNSPTRSGSSREHRQTTSIHQCEAVVVSQQEVLREIESALSSGRTVSLLASVAADSEHAEPAKHAVLASSAHEHPSLRSEKHALTMVMPVLSAILGGEKRMWGALMETREFSAQTKALRRQRRVHAVRSAMRGLSEHLTEAQVLAYGSTLLSKAQLETVRLLQTHSIEGKGAQLHVGRGRVVVGAGVRGPSIPPVGKLQELIDRFPLHLGDLVQRPISAKKWELQGQGRVRILRDVVRAHLQWLFELGAFLDTCQRDIELVLRIGDDFGKILRWVVPSQETFLQSVSIGWQRDVFQLGIECAVQEPHVLVLASDSDTIDSAQFWGGQISKQLESLSLPILVLDEDGQTAHSVRVRVCSFCLAKFG